MKLGVYNQNSCLRVAGWFAALWLVLFAASLSTGCSAAPKLDPDSALSAAQETCRLYEMLPPDKRDERSDKACFVVKRLCIDPALPPAELKAPAPAMGNKLVDAGAGGSGGDGG